MSEEKTKSHKLNLFLSTDEKWKTKDVAEQVEELLIELQEGYGPFDDVRAHVDPINKDSTMPDAAEDSARIISVYCDSLRRKADEYGMLDIVQEGISKIEHGVTDLHACVRCMDIIPNKIVEKAIPIDLGDIQSLAHAPREILHIIAHKLGLEPGECEDMEPEDLLEWIKGNTSKGRTIN